MSQEQNKTKEKQSIAKFVRHIGEENYAEANKYLKKTIEHKLFNKIKEFKNINIFRNE